MELAKTMIQDSVIDWQELSALYERVDGFDQAELRAWLSQLRVEKHRLLPQLERMLDARAHVADGEFLRELPAIGAPLDVSEPDRQEGSRVGPYSLVRHLGSGGMSEVWLANRVDGAFERQVAIKLLHQHPARAQQAAFFERFKRERGILASLDHPNIASLHDAGVAPGGQPWLALDYVEGLPITAWCDRERLTIEARVHLALQMLLAVEHAHARLVIHRDIKPSNVLVDESGVVRLLDFGIAKLLVGEGQSLAETALTRQGGRPLTPEYASPEQFRGDPLTTACDVYSLGVLLHEVLVGDLPYALKGKSAAALEAEIVEVDSPPPSRKVVADKQLAFRKTDAVGLRRSLRPDLDAIVLRALHKSPERRYESVGAMRADLERWLRSEPVLATVPGPLYRAGKFVRRHRFGVAVGGAFVVVAALAAGLTAQQRLRAEHEASRAIASKDFLLDTFRLSDPAQTKGGDVSAGQLLDASMERANRSLVDQPELHAQVLESIAEIDQNLDRYGRAREALEQASQIYETSGRLQDWARMRLTLADNAFRMGDSQQAEALVRGVRSVVEGFPQDHALQGRQHEVLGWLAEDRGDLTEAKGQMLAALASAKLADGGMPVIDALRGLAAVEISLKEFEQARQHLRDAGALAQRSPEASITDVMAIDMERASAEFASGQYAEALPFTASVLTNCDKALGAKNETCFLIRQQQILLLIKIGAVSKAVQSLPAMAVEAENGLSPRRQAQAKVAILRVLAASARWDDAHRVALDLRDLLDNEQNRPLPDYLVLAAYQAIAELELREGAGRRAQETLDGLVLRVRADGIDKAFRARTLMLQGLASGENGDYVRSLETLKVATAAYADSFGADHTQTLLCQLNQVRALRALGQQLQAARLIEDILPTLRRRMPVDSPILEQIAETREGLIRPDKSDARREAAPFFN